MLTTLLAEVTAIMNARPLIPVLSVPENPHILTASMLLTQKSDVKSSPDIDISGGRYSEISVETCNGVRSICVLFNVVRNGHAKNPTSKRGMSSFLKKTKLEGTNGQCV